MDRRLITELAEDMAEELGITREDNPDLYAEMVACIRADVLSFPLADAREEERKKIDN